MQGNLRKTFRLLVDNGFFAFSGREDGVKKRILAYEVRLFAVISAVGKLIVDAA